MAKTIIPRIDKIYALVDPRTNEIRYVGFTSGTLKVRLRNHLCPEKSSSHRHVYRWIHNLQEINLVPKIELLEIVPNGSSWSERERFWIAYGHKNNWPLTNHTDGGEGTLGLSEDARKRLSQSLTGRKISDETRKRLSQALSGRKLSKETKILVGIATKRNWSNPEFRENIGRKVSLALKGRTGKKHSEETKKKMSITRRNKHKTVAE